MKRTEHLWYVKQKKPYHSKKLLWKKINFMVKYEQASYHQKKNNVK